MAVKLRLARYGAKKSPFYRIVAMDSRKARNGQCIEQLGYYNPVANPPVVKIDAEKAQKWLETGAIPTDTVKMLLEKQGLVKKVSATAKKEKAEKRVANKAEKSQQAKAKTAEKQAEAKATAKKAPAKKAEKHDDATAEKPVAEKAEKAPAKKTTAKKAEKAE